LDKEQQREAAGETPDHVRHCHGAGRPRKPAAHASAAFIRAIWKIRDSISLRSEQPSAVTQAA
jgi:hypothetical protein